jgi:hypothetical protein
MWFMSYASYLSLYTKVQQMLASVSIWHLRRQKRQAMGLGRGSKGARTGGGDPLPLSSGRAPGGGCDGTKLGGTKVFPRTGGSWGPGMPMCIAIWLGIGGIPGIGGPFGKPFIPIIASSSA